MTAVNHDAYCPPFNQTRSCLLDSHIKVTGILVEKFENSL